MAGDIAPALPLCCQNRIGGKTVKPWVYRLTEIIIKLLYLVFMTEDILYCATWSVMPENCMSSLGIVDLVEMFTVSLLRTLWTATEIEHVPI